MRFFEKIYAKILKKIRKENLHGIEAGSASAPIQKKFPNIFCQIFYFLKLWQCQSNSVIYKMLKSFNIIKYYNILIQTTLVIYIYTKFFVGI